MVNLMRIAKLTASAPESAGYGLPDPGDGLFAPAWCGTLLETSRRAAYVWQRYVNHTAQFLGHHRGSCDARAPRSTDLCQHRVDFGRIVAVDSDQHFERL